MSADKYPSIFSRQMETIVYIFSRQMEAIVVYIFVFVWGCLTLLQIIRMAFFYLSLLFLLYM